MGAFSPDSRSIAKVERGIYIEVKKSRADKILLFISNILHVMGPDRPVDSLPPLHSLPP
jgi:hypothetical protein